uniref:Uncharacterized protein n=1 Tax=Moniliophthora roreri TaxID=221103 RepID=A0A0W0F513_MONRR
MSDNDESNTEKPLPPLIDAELINAPERTKSAYSISRKAEIAALGDDTESMRNLMQGSRSSATCSSNFARIEKRITDKQERTVDLPAPSPQLMRSVLA